MNRTLFLMVLALLPSLATAQDLYQHRLTAAVGRLNPTGTGKSGLFDSAPLLAFDYGYRFHRYSQADIGVDLGFASEKVSKTRRNVYIPRFGYRFILPLMDDRVEAHVGAGAGHGFIKPTVRGSESWLVYGQFGGSYAIDAAKNYRAGMTVRWFRDPIGVPVQQWIAVSAEFSYSFGR